MSIWMIPIVLGMTLMVWGMVQLIHRMRTVEHIHCAEKDLDVDLEFERGLTPAWSPGKKLDVVRCSAFSDPCKVSCDKACLAAR